VLAQHFARFKDLPILVLVQSKVNKEEWQRRSEAHAGPPI
jgi:hypothetical protein